MFRNIIRKTIVMLQNVVLYVVYREVTYNMKCFSSIIYIFINTINVNPTFYYSVLTEITFCDPTKIGPLLRTLVSPIAIAFQQKPSPRQRDAMIQNSLSVGDSIVHFISIQCTKKKQT